MEDIMGIYINDERKLFSLTTENTEYAFCIDNQDRKSVV